MFPLGNFQTSPNYLTLQIDVSENLKSLLYHFTKKNCSCTKKRKPKLTKIKLNLNKKKILTKTSSKDKHTKTDLCHKKNMMLMTNKKGLSY